MSPRPIIGVLRTGEKSELTLTLCREHWRAYLRSQPRQALEQIAARFRLKDYRVASCSFGECEWCKVGMPTF